MLFIQRLLISASCTLCVASLSFGANDYSAGYRWRFVGGNLVSNWSFEGLSEELCKLGAFNNMVTDCRAPDSDAKGGSFVLNVTTGNATTVGYDYSQFSDYLKCEPSTTYLVSYYVKATWVNRNASNYPRLYLYKGNKSLITTSNAPSYESAFSQNTGGWKKYSFTFETGADVTLFRFGFLYSTSQSNNAGNNFKFDNIIISKVDADQGVVESRVYGDAVGRVEQTVSNDGTRELVGMSFFDDEGRPSRNMLPVPTTTGFAYDLTTICIGARNLGENLEYDAATLLEAYNKLKVAVSNRDMSGQPNPVLNVIVNSSGSLAPIGSFGGSLTPLRDKNQAPVSFQIRGVIKYSTEYNNLVTQHTTVASTQGRYGTASFEYMHSGYYPSSQNAWTEYAYPVPGVSTASQVAIPGAGYGISSGHVQKSGWAFVLNVDIPNPVEVGATSASGEAPYHYQWNKDRQGNYSLSWTNAEGRLVKTVQGAPGNWLTTTYDYDPNGFGLLLGTNTPGGMYYDNEYNGLGQVTATIDPDRGRMEHLYDFRGRLRFSRPGSDVSQMIATRYDTLGRPLGSGKWSQTWSQTTADNYSGTPTGSPDIGYIYDEFSTFDFEAQTGVGMLTIGLNYSKLTNGRGRLIASYNRNPESAIPGLTAPERKLVATFYAYDTKGRVTYIYRYLGSIENAADRLQKIKYTYDAHDRLESKIVYKNYSSDEVNSIPSSESYFIYDASGRVAYVLDKDSKVMVQYHYNAFEQTVGVTLYDKIKVNYSYNILGALTKIEAFTTSSPPEYIFSEELGYEDKPNGHANILNLPEFKKRWDGKISSVLKKYSKEIANPVELFHYAYDVFGRLGSSYKYISNTSALNTDGSINLQNLNFPTSESEAFQYGNDGQITSRNASGGGVFQYEYRNNNGPTHQVSKVGPGLRRTGESMTAPGDNFLYDSRGRMWRDVGLNKTLTYGYASNLPTKVSMSSRNFHMLYDENNYRTAEIEEVGNSIVGQKAYIYESGLDVAKEIISRTSAHPLGAVNLVKNNLQGANSIVGVESEIDGKKKILLKDHLGSVTKVVDEGTGIAIGEEEYAHSLYGILTKKVTASGDLKPTGTYSGKEYEEALKMYYFGARYFDPELAIWLTPDAMFEFFNPYGRSGDPVNFVDPDGNCEIICAVLIVGGAYVGGAIAQKYTKRGKIEWNPIDWQANDWRTYAGIAAGGLAGWGASAGMTYLGINQSLTFGYEGMNILTLSQVPGGGLAVGGGITGFGSAALSIYDHYSGDNGVDFDGDPYAGMTAEFGPIEVNDYSDPEYYSNPYLYPQLAAAETPLDFAALAYSAYLFRQEMSLKNGIYLGWDLTATAFPGVPASWAIGGFGRVARASTVYHKHHTIPREILKQLPPDVARAVRGKAGAPNRWSIPEDVHKAIHKGPGGGAYNEAFKQRLGALGRDPTAAEVMRIRDDLVKQFGLGGYRP